MEGNGTETKYMLNSAICVQKRPWPLEKKKKGIAVTKHDAAPKQCHGAIYFSKGNYSTVFGEHEGSFYYLLDSPRAEMLHTSTVCAGITSSPVRRP